MVGAHPEPRACGEVQLVHGETAERFSRGDFECCTSPTRPACCGTSLIGAPRAINEDLSISRAPSRAQSFRTASSVPWLAEHGPDPKGFHSRVVFDPHRGVLRTRCHRVGSRADRFHSVGRSPRANESRCGRRSLPPGLIGVSCGLPLFLFMRERLARDLDTHSTLRSLPRTGRKPGTGVTSKPCWRIFGTTSFLRARRRSR